VIGPIIDSNFGDTVALLVAVHGDRYGYRELKDYVERIEDELRTVPNVAKLRRYGEQSEQIWITSSLQRISQYFANPDRIIQALQQRNIIQNSGDLLIPREDVPMRTNGLLLTESQIKRIMVDVSHNTGQPVYIGDFANVERRYQDPDQIARFDGALSVLLSGKCRKDEGLLSNLAKRSTSSRASGFASPDETRPDCRPAVCSPQADQRSATRIPARHRLGILVTIIFAAHSRGADCRHCNPGDCCRDARVLDTMDSIASGLDRRIDRVARNLLMTRS
jgi:hypothetical protein